MSLRAILGHQRRANEALATNIHADLHLSCMSICQRAAGVTRARDSARCEGLRDWTGSDSCRSDSPVEPFIARPEKERRVCLCVYM